MKRISTKTAIGNSETKRNKEKSVFQTKVYVSKLNVYYGDNQVLRNVNAKLPERRVISLIGASGCGKSTFLRCINRMNDFIDSCRIEGKIKIGKVDIYDSHVDPVELRLKVGMVFQKPNPFPKSIYDNIAYGPRIHRLFKTKKELNEIVHGSLEKAGLLAEVKDRLSEPGTRLSGGQQQRLCIARAIAINPEVILMDEPCSALDPVATAKIEDLIGSLRDKYTIVVVTHSMQQATRISDYTGFFHLGKLVEFDTTRELFSNPKKSQTQYYLDGKYG